MTTQTAHLSVLESVLKKPQSIAEISAAEEDLVPRALRLLGFGIAAHAAFAAMFGLFGGSEAMMMTTGKSVMVMSATLCLCLPSLYIFAALGGLPLTIRQTLFVLGASVSVMGFMLLGLLPVMWLFSVSTHASSFVIVFGWLGWLVAIIFVLRFWATLSGFEAFAKMGGVRFWLVIYALVLFQMTTHLRPYLGPDDGAWWAKDRQFFAEHLASSLGESKEESEVR